MQQLLILSVLLTCSTGAVVEKKAQLDINQKVYVGGSPVLGDGAGEAALNVCQSFASGASSVKVCGTGIKTTVFMRGRCESYYTHQATVGQCSTGMSSSTCDEWSPGSAGSAYQSYLIEQC